MRIKTIKELREMTGLTQEEFGKQMFGIPRRTVQSWEIGDRKPTEYVRGLIQYKVESEKREKENGNEKTEVHHDQFE